MTRVIMIRHGETLWNLEKREIGQYDSQLSKNGEMQAKALAKRLERDSFTALYSSDLGRAMQTAEYIASITGKEIKPDIELRERNMGIFQGYTKEEIKERYPGEWSKYNSAKKFDYIIPNGESQRQRYERSIRVFNRLASKHQNEAIVIVSHDGILRSIFEYVLGLSPGYEARFKRRNATYNVFSKQENKWSLDVWGDTSHLSDYDKEKSLNKRMH